MKVFSPRYIATLRQFSRGGISVNHAKKLNWISVRWAFYNRHIVLSGAWIVTTQEGEDLLHAYNKTHVDLRKVEANVPDSCRKYVRKHPASAKQRRRVA